MRLLSHRNSITSVYICLISLAVQFKVYFCGHSTVGNALTNSAEGMDILLPVSVMCCKGRCLTDGLTTRLVDSFRMCVCECLIVCNLENQAMGRPLQGQVVDGQKNLILFYKFVGLSIGFFPSPYHISVCPVVTSVLRTFKISCVTWLYLLIIFCRLSFRNM